MKPRRHGMILAALFIILFPLAAGNAGGDCGMTPQESSVLQMAGYSVTAADRGQLTPAQASILDGYDTAAAAIARKYPDASFALSAVRIRYVLQDYHAFIFTEAAYSAIVEARVYEQEGAFRERDNYFGYLRQDVYAQWVKAALSGQAPDAGVLCWLTGFTDEGCDASTVLTPELVRSENLAPSVRILLNPGLACESSLPALAEKMKEALTQAGMQGIYSIFLLKDPLQNEADIKTISDKINSSVSGAGLFTAHAGFMIR